MSEQDRRTFLKTAAGAVPVAAIVGSLGVKGSAPKGPAAEAGAAATRPQVTMPEEPLRALADIALPATELGPEGTAEAVRGFRAWVEGFEPAAELDHGYLTDELRYGPPHPGPRWTAQLEAMDLESKRRSGLSLAEIGVAERGDAVRRALRGGGANLPGSPAQADHVVVGLLAWFYGTPLATDLCYRAEVGRHRCRGIRSLPEEPSPTVER